MIAECLLIKNENRYLLEHLAYNAAAGIDHFFIYDNLSDTPVADYLRENAREFLNICTITRYLSLMKWQEVTLQTKQPTPPII